MHCGTGYRWKRALQLNERVAFPTITREQAQQGDVSQNLELVLVPKKLRSNIGSSSYAVWFILGLNL